MKVLANVRVLRCFVADVICMDSSKSIHSHVPKKVYRTKVLTRVVFLLLMVAVIMSGCGSKPVPVKEKPIQIGLLIDSVVVERWQRDRDIFSAKAKELGAEVIVQNCNEDNAIQETQIRNMTNDNPVDVLVVIPYDKDGLANVIKSARKKGIPVIAYDRLIRDAGVDLYISFDNVLVGEMMGSELVKKVPEGKYMIVNGSPLDNNSYLFNTGYKNALLKSIETGKIDIISETWAEAWRPEDAYQTVNETVQGGQKIDAIIAANDGLADGAIRALTENRMAGEVQVVGHDADLSACQRIAEGTQYITVYKPIKELAQSAAIAAVQLAKGEKVTADDVIFDGTSDVPYIKFQPVIVNRNNLVQTVIRDGFHEYEDVFRNVQEAERPPKE